MAKIATTQSKNGAATRGSQKSSGTDQAEVQRIAYQLFVERGYQHGHDREDWIRAEAIVKNRKKS